MNHPNVLAKMKFAIYLWIFSAASLLVKTSSLFEADLNFNLTLKHDISIEDFNNLVFKTLLPSRPLGYAKRVRRQINDGSSQYVYDTDTDESSGEWGPWEAKGPCSRSCGGGVLTEERTCQNGDCTGPSKRFSSCNLSPCPGESSGDFRQEQCSKFNSVPFERKLYEWIPYLKAPRKCELNCMPKGERFYYRHEKKVINCLLLINCENIQSM